MMRVIVVLGVLALLLPTTVGVAANDAPATLRDRLLQDLAERGLGLADLPDPVPLQVMDLGSGQASIEEESLDAFLERLAEAPAGLGPGAPDAASHRVVGDVTHSCYDPIRKDCYKFYTNQLGEAQPTLWRDLEDEYASAKAAYDGTLAKGALAFPVQGGAAMMVHGVYASGLHKAANPVQYASLGNSNAGVSLEDGLPGSGATHADRAMWGAGAGRVFVVNFSWGEGLFISVGQLRAHGVWTFCDSEAHPDCVAP